MRVLQPSFAGINSRFHLVGIYALASLLMGIAGALADGSADWFGALLPFLLVIYAGVTFGILGTVCHAASGRKDRPPFLRYATSLFLPLLWLQIKIGLLLGAPTMAIAWFYWSAPGSGLSYPQALERTGFHLQPALLLAAQVLALYAIPWCILGRERGEWRPHIRAGLAFFRSRPAESARLVLLLLGMAVLEGAFAYARGFESRSAGPTFADGLLLLAQSYLDLVAIFGACLVILTGAREGQTPDLRA
ncbi:MAG: hypothetical protein ACE5JH_05380 [Acidobacteriota bacterium]